MHVLRVLSPRLDELAVGVVIAQLSHEDADLRSSAEEVLIISANNRLGDATVKSLVKLLLSEADSNACKSALTVLKALAPRLGNDAMRAIVSQVNNKSWPVRMIALNLLGSLDRPLDETAVRIITTLLRQEPWGDVRKTAQSVLTKLVDPQDKTAMQLLDELLNDGELKARKSAQIVLEALAVRLDEMTERAIISSLSREDSGLGEGEQRLLLPSADRQGDSASQSNVEVLCDANSNACENALTGLSVPVGCLYETNVGVIISQLRHEDWGLREKAERVLLASADQLDEQTVKTLVEMLNDTDLNASKRAMSVLEVLTDRLDDEAVGVLIAQLSRENSDLRDRAEQVLRESADRLSVTAVKSLVEVVRGADMNACQCALSVLKALSNRLEDDAIRAIVLQVRARDWKMRNSALSALITLEKLSDHLDDNAVRAIVAVLDDTEIRAHEEAQDYVWCSCSALDALKMVSHRLDDLAVRVIVKRLSDSDKRVKAHAMRTLSALPIDYLNEADVLPILAFCGDLDPGGLGGREELFYPNQLASSVLIQLVETLGQGVVRVIVSALKHKDLQHSAMSFLLDLPEGCLDDEAVHAIVTVLNDKDVSEGARNMAIRTLIWNRTLSQAAVRAIAKGLNNKDKDVRSRAMFALNQLPVNGLDDTAVRALVMRLTNGDDLERKNALYLLQRAHSSGLRLPRLKSRLRQHATAAISSARIVPYVMSAIYFKISFKISIYRAFRRNTYSL
jgi:hypothetical protein